MISIVWRSREIADVKSHLVVILLEKQLRPPLVRINITNNHPKKDTDLANYPHRVMKGGVWGSMLDFIRRIRLIITKILRNLSSHHIS